MIVGAVIGVLGTLFAQFLAERRAVKSILQAIVTELRVLQRDFFDKLQRQLNEWHETQEVLREHSFTNRLKPFAMTRTDQNYFIVFESNAGTLGRIKRRN